MRRTITCLLLGLGFCHPLAAQGIFINYSTADGMVSNDSKSVAVDQLGRVWIGAKGIGLSMFNGTYFTKYTPVNSSLDGSPIKNIFIDSRGRIWFCQASSGLAIYDGTSWYGYSSTDGLIYNHTFMVAEYSGKYLVATQLGLGILDGVQWSSLTRFDGLAEDFLGYVYVDSKNTVWLGNRTMGVTYGNPEDGWTTTDLSDDDTPTQVRVLLEDLDGNLWIGTRGKGAVRYDGSEWKTFTTSDGLGSDNIWGMAVDSSGNMWFATNGGGLSVFSGSNWDTYTVEDAGYTGEDHAGWIWASAVAVAADGSIWVVTGAGASRLPPENIRPLGPICDINRDGRNNVIDIFSLILIQRNNSSDPRADHNGDGQLSIADVIDLLLDIRDGVCNSP
ncbi:MAG: hypothetical protein FVQ81_15085 [Candidatus Glassbacteria bacterium]|nr:hypothetical protein [Candidatus Glassbacteria bacterium]